VWPPHVVGSCWCVQNCGRFLHRASQPRVRRSPAAGSFVGGAASTRRSRAPGPRSRVPRPHSASCRFQCGESACGSIGTSANSLTLPYLNVDEPGTRRQAASSSCILPICWCRAPTQRDTLFIVAFLIAALSALLLAGWLSTVSASRRSQHRHRDMPDRLSRHQERPAPLRNVFAISPGGARYAAELPSVAERQGTVESRYQLPGDARRELRQIVLRSQSEGHGREHRCAGDDCASGSCAHQACRGTRRSRPGPPLVCGA